MIPLFILILALVWFIATCLRIYRQGRFYQIEEYMSLRYLRWVVSRRDRWLPTRPLMAFVISALITLLMTEASDGIFPFIVGMVGALVAATPPREGEVKKQFRPTARAKRLLAASFVVALLCFIIGLLLIGQIDAGSFIELPFVLVAALGWLAHTLAPVWLVLGNLVMTPGESALRQRFVNQARAVLERVNPIVIGITGSYGKTSTKTYLSHILNGRYKAYPTPKSYNTMMGVCIAINNDLANDYSVDYFVCEMGAYIPGEIQAICDLTHPTISVVIEVGPQHLERFGTLENIATAKYEIIKALPPDGVGVFNWDNPYVREMYERGYPQTRLAVSREADPANPPPHGPRFIASAIDEQLDGLRFTVTDVKTQQNARFETPLLGLHNVTNILLATAIAVHEGIPLADIARRVRTLQPAESRLARLTTPQGITILNDAYSANPVGIVHALRVLSMHPADKRLLITPGMVELGPLEAQENRKLGEIAAQHATDVILIGSARTAPIKEGLLAAGFPAERVQVMERLNDSKSWYERNLKPGDVVLFLNDLPDTYSS
ncbi:MAG: UDP-N-acetylmuramoyl-tripeptide--D-alanyl-D-alanine ligase [Chloroflexota bacterium]|nr:UDP-N-acetylmuramoyl-tripeptide--D-alanyl-D-alanine ligase [Chloroflexota bacterium]